MRRVPTFTGEVNPDDLGTTLIHEHVFVTCPELDRDLPHPEWDAGAAVERAVAQFEVLHELGVRTVVDLTVPGLGRDVALVGAVAARTKVNIIASTGYYTADVLPLGLRHLGPGRMVDAAEPLAELFIRDIDRGIAGTDVRAGMLKVASDEAGITPDVERVFAAAAGAHHQTGVPITTHSHAASRGGEAQQDLLERLGVPLDRVVIGHSCDTDDLDYLRSVADRGSFLGFDRFGMEHVFPDAERVATLLALLEAGYEDQIVLSQDAAIFSRVTPPSWRTRHTPEWAMDHLALRVVPRLRDAGVGSDMIDKLLVANPRRVLAGG